MATATSIKVYNQIKSEGLLSDKRMKVYEIFMEYGELTGSQVSEIYKSLHPTSQHSETIRNRITELRDMGVLEELGTTICHLSKREVVKFGLTDQLPNKLEKKVTRKEQVDEVLEYITMIGKQCPDLEVKQSLRQIYFKVRKLKQ